MRGIGSNVGGWWIIGDIVGFWIVIVGWCWLLINLCVSAMIFMYAIWPFIICWIRSTFVYPTMFN